MNPGPGLRRAAMVLPAAGGALFLLLGAAGPWVAGERVSGSDLGAALRAPDISHPFGTDQLGRDVAWRVVAGAHDSAIAVILALLTCLVVGGALGLAAGWHGGVTDRVVLRIVDLATCVPSFLVALFLAGLMGGSSFAIALALALSAWPPYVRVIRTETLVRRGDPSGLSLLMLGASPARVLVRHVLPALFLPVTVLMGATTAQTILSVATLSFLGLGAQPPSPE